MSYPSPPPVDRSPTTSGPARASVRTAALLVYGLVALGVIRTIAAIAAKDTLINSYLDSKGIDPNSELSQVARDGAPAYVPVAIASLVIFGALLLLLAYFFTKGRTGPGSLPSSSAPWVPLVGY